MNTMCRTFSHNTTIKCHSRRTLESNSDLHFGPSRLVTISRYICSYIYMYSSLLHTANLGSPESDRKRASSMTAPKHTTPIIISAYLATKTQCGTTSQQGVLHNYPYNHSTPIIISARSVISTTHPTPHTSY